MQPFQRLNNARRLLKRRRELRAGSTPAENRLWQALQGSGLHNRKFRRQQSIGPYIVDFYCASEKLIVELDGAAHDSEKAAGHDLARQHFLYARDLTVVRIENRHVMQNLDGVLAYISQHFHRS